MTAPVAPSPSHPSAHPDPSRSGAVWVTGLGAFLLLMAASVFTAIHWEQVPDAAKLGALMAATGACLVAGRGLRPSLPATAAALFHLGTFLVPVDVAAIAIHRHLDWGGVLLAEGIVGAITFAWASTTEHSVVLRWAFRASVIVLAGGIAATTPMSAPLALAIAAGVALLLDREADAGLWAALAGAAPLLATLDSLTTGAGTLERLGLAGDPSRATAALSGLGAAAVLATLAHRRQHVALGVTSLAVCGLGIVTSWTGVGASGEVTGIALAVAFLVVELLALVTAEDPFWSQPTRLIATAAEVPATLAALGALGSILIVPLLDGTRDTAGAVAFAALATGWLAAAQRRPAHARFGSVVAVATSAAAAAACATTGGPWFVASLLAIGVALVLADEPAAALIAPVTTMLATGVAVGIWEDGGSHLILAAVGPVGLAGSLLVAEVAVRRSRRWTGPSDHRTPAVAAVLGLASLLPGALAMLVLAVVTDEPVIVLASTVIAATGLALVLDRARTTDLPLGTIARVAALAPALVAASMGLEARDVAIVAIVTVAGSALDAVRQRQPLIAIGAAAALPLAVVELARSAGLSSPGAGVAAAVAAIVVAGVGASIDRRWLAPIAIAVGACAGVALVLALPDPTAFADVLMLLGGLGVAGSIEQQRLDTMAISGLVVTGGIWLRLADAQVTALEPYLLPVAVLLLVTGLRAWASGASSWIAYGPAIGLFGGAALAERLGGGAGWHALVAGAVGVTAVVAGGQRRLAAPLLLGTGLLLTLAGYETLAITAGFPTWVWLALGGLTLLGAGVAMERHDVGPLETGKRLVDTVADRYA